MGETERRRCDLVVFGATSFVGSILCKYFDERLGESSFSWSIAGRNEVKLNRLRASLKTPVEVIIADAENAADMASLVREAPLIVSTVGPYAKYGSLLVDAATASGTDYCDLTGEPQWMQRMIDEHSEAANASGARIVHACGFDSIPSDLGVAFTQDAAHTRFGTFCSQVSMRVKALKGGVSGGTVASMLNVVEEASHDKHARRILANPYALAPLGMREGIAQPNVLAPKGDDVSGGWIAPFMMAAVNTRVVHRSHALKGRPWREDFLYDEATMTGSGPSGLAKASAVAGGLGGLTAATSVGVVRRALEQRILPKPGEGPSPEQQQSGFFDLRFFGTTNEGDSIQTKVTGDRDPGYGSTAKMLGEAAIALAKTDPANLPGGFWTPGTAFGLSLIPPLQTYAGLRFEIVD